ncbi:MAG TPA: formate dehydrogenase subunit gamma [Xanthobacteraceae bacterium]|nr:formate dehydrogenase subunit gamma [Xanthobacteraceae bacterium]
MIRLRLVIAAIAVVLLAAGMTQVGAQQPSSVDPNASAVQEQQLLQQLNRIQGLGSIPDTRSYVIEQPMGRVWRQFHEVWLRWIGGGVILGVVALMTMFFLIRGRVRIAGGLSGRTVVRFTSFERFTHWMTATSFVILAVTGLNITFGKELVLPLIGAAAFSRWSIMAKYAHDFSSFPFVFGVATLFVMWIKDNFPTAADIQWFKDGGGMIGDKHVPAWKFNGGQKLQFWLACLCTIAAAGSGLFLLFPFYLTNIFGMQIAQGIHALTAVGFVGLILAHIYIGSVGMEGGFHAMATGEVDLNWIKQHHSLWLEQEFGQGRTAPPPAGATTRPAS